MAWWMGPVICGCIFRAMFQKKGEARGKRAYVARGLASPGRGSEESEPWDDTFSSLLDLTSSEVAASGSLPV